MKSSKGIAVAEKLQSAARMQYIVAEVWLIQISTDSILTLAANSVYVIALYADDAS